MTLDISTRGGDDGVLLTKAYDGAAGLDDVAGRGPLHTSTAVVIPSDLAARFIASKITAAIPDGDGFTDSVFYTPKIVTLATTLAAVPVVGQPTLQVVDVSGLAVERWLIVYTGGAASTYFQAGVGVTGSTDITAASLYGSGGTLDGLTVALDTGGGPLSLVLSGAGNAASEAVLIAAIKARWPALAICKQGGSTGVGLVLTAPSLAIGSGTAHAALGISGLNTVQVERPVLLAYAVGEPVYASSPARDITIDFGGAEVDAEGGSRSLWLPYNVDCHYAHLVVHCSSASFGPDFDLGGLRSSFDDIRAIFVSRTVQGFVVEGGCEEVSLSRCVAEGGFQQAFYLCGVNCTVRDFAAYGYTFYGAVLQESGAGDVFSAAGYCLENGQLSGAAGAQYGVWLRSNSARNTLIDVRTSDHVGAGFYVATGAAVPVTIGAADNTHVACVSERDAIGFVAGDGSTGADGTSYLACRTLATTAAAWLVQADATNTSLDGCIAESGAADAFVIHAPATLIGCRSTKNAARGLYVTGRAHVTNYTSIGDAASSAAREVVRIDGSGQLTLIGGRVEQVGVGAWNGISHYSSADQTLTDIDVIITGTGCVGLGVAGTGTVNLRDFRVTGDGAGNWGAYIAGGATVHFGPGCRFGTIFVAPSATVTIAPTGGTASLPGAIGASTMTFEQHYATSIVVGATAPISSGTQTIAPLASFEGQALDVTNFNTGSSVTTVFGITIPVGATYRIRCRAGAWEHVSLS